MRKIIVFISIFFTCSYHYAQNKSVVKPKLYLSLSEYGPKMKKFTVKNNISNIQNINGADFFGKEDYTFDPKLLKEQIESVVPNQNSKGIVYIDIEGSYLEDIMNKGTQIESFKKSIKLYIDVIKFAKKIRPNTQWGYYYIPYTSYWNRNSDFYGKIKKIEPLIKECDVLFPSLYIFYDENNNKSVALENEKCAIENTKEMIKVGQYYKKPVIIFVWHRFHPSNDKLGMELLPEKVFLTQIKRIITTSYKGMKVNGIVWWSADDYFFRQNEKGVIKEFKGTAKEYKAYNDSVLLRKAKKIKILLDQ